MEKKSLELVHCFDTQRHLILCGAGRFELRSTKHARGVTCQACIELLAAKSTASPEVATEGARHTVV